MKDCDSNQRLVPTSHSIDAILGFLPTKKPAQEPPINRAQLTERNGGKNCFTRWLNNFKIKIHLRSKIYSRVFNLMWFKFVLKCNKVLFGVLRNCTFGWKSEKKKEKSNGVYFDTAKGTGKSICDLPLPWYLQARRAVGEDRPTRSPCAGLVSKSSSKIETHWASQELDQTPRVISRHSSKMSTLSWQC